MGGRGKVGGRYWLGSMGGRYNNGEGERDGGREREVGGNKWGIFTKPTKRRRKQTLTVSFKI